MKEFRLNDLTQLGDCVICGRKQLEGRLPLFYVVEITRVGFEPGAIRRAAGLEMQIGALAAVMGPDEPLARAFDGPRRVFVHEECSDKVHHLLDLMTEASDR